MFRNIWVFLKRWSCVSFLASCFVSSENYISLLLSSLHQPLEQVCGEMVSMLIIWVPSVGKGCSPASFRAGPFCLEMLLLKSFPSLKGTQHSLPVQLVQACRNCLSTAANCAFSNGCVQFRPICAQPRDGSCVFKVMIMLPNPICWEHQAAVFFSPLFSVSNPQERLWGTTPEYWLFKGKMDVVLFHLWYQ